jgi:hypothetical protein
MFYESCPTQIIEKLDITPIEQFLCGDKNLVRHFFCSDIHKNYNYIII